MDDRLGPLGILNPNTTDCPVPAGLSLAVTSRYETCSAPSRISYEETTRRSGRAVAFDELRASLDENRLATGSLQQGCQAYPTQELSS